MHATLALAAATSVGTAGPDGHACADAASTRLAARKPDPSPDSSPGPDPQLGRLRRRTGRAIRPVPVSASSWAVRCAAGCGRPRPGGALGYPLRIGPMPRGAVAALLLLHPLLVVDA
jgi:hypothetical protein